MLPMQRIQFHQPQPLHDTSATRTLEAQGMAAHGPHTLMQRAGAAIAQLAQAIAPHAQTIWIAAGAGNNGGDGLEAAALLRKAGRRVLVSWLGDPNRAPQDSLLSLQHARNAEVSFVDAPPDHLGPHDLCIDALLGLGLRADASARAPSPALIALLQAVRKTPAITLCVDVPSGLIADTGQHAPGFAHIAASPPANAGPRHTLSLLTLKPGLFTGVGRDESGMVWLDGLGVDPSTQAPSAWLAGRAPTTSPRPSRPHASHKGSWGDVAIVGGEGLRQRGMGMTGAALLAASAALHAGAGRVMLAPLDADLLQLPGELPEIMLRRFDRLELENITTVCGCGGGAAIHALMPELLVRAQRLVLDADALNAIAADPELQQLTRQRAANPRHITAMTPHPLEAARLLGCDTATVQADRLHAAQRLAELFHCVVNLKGSGSIIAAPEHTPVINATGNARLATGGTGDVLAGLLGARLAALPVDACECLDLAFHATCKASWQHGWMADHWSGDSSLTASALARSLMPQ